MKSRIILLLSFVMMAMGLSAQSLVFHYCGGENVTVKLPATVSPPASLPAGIVQAGEKQGSNKSYGFVQQKLWFCSAKVMVLFSKSYGFVQQKLWFCSAKVPPWLKTDKKTVLTIKTFNFRKSLIERKDAEDESI